MVEHLDKMVEAGVTSFKIEGRMKSPFCVATVVNTYRRALDLLEKNPKKFKVNPEWKTELENCSHRKFTTGFCMGENDRECLESSIPISKSEFIAIVIASTKGGFCEVEQRNRFKVGDELEILSPTTTFKKKFIVEEMFDLEGNPIYDALRVQQKIKLKVPFKLMKGDILRISS